MKLLQKPLRAFVIYAMLILAISIPTYFFVVDYIWLMELDEHNQILKDRIVKNIQDQTLHPSGTEINLEVLKVLQPGTHIEAVGAMQPDRIYDIFRKTDEPDGETDRFRGLESYFEWNHQPYRITVETNLEEADETLLAIAVVTVFFMLVLIFGFIWLNRKIAAKSWKPFYRTLEQLKAFELLQGSSPHFDKTDILEFQEMNRAIENLMQENISAYKQQQRFTENASHELQTPIALLKAKLDHLLQQKNLSPEIKSMIDGVQSPLSRLSRVNKNLLLLAKVENFQSQETMELSLKEVFNDALMLFEDYLQEKHLKLSVDLPENVRLTVHPFLLETLIQNLISNAIRYTEEGGSIKIEGEEHRFSVSNSGVSPLIQEGLFKRFSKVSEQQVSSGLGLAIVREVAEKCRWTIRYEFVNQFHRFIVDF